MSEFKVKVDIDMTNQKTDPIRKRKEALKLLSYAYDLKISSGAIDSLIKKMQGYKHDKIFSSLS